MKNDKKFDVLYEDTLYRFQQGGLLQGDVVKIRGDALNNDKIKPMAENVKEQIKNAIDTDLNLRVSAIRSIRPNTTQNYNGFGTDAPADYFVDIVVEYAPGLWREPMTLPIEILERVDTGINMAPVPDSLKRPNNELKEADVEVSDSERANPKSNTQLSNTPEPEDGRSQAKSPEERKTPKGEPEKLTEKLEDVYGGMLVENTKQINELHGEGQPAKKIINIEFAKPVENTAQIVGNIKALLGDEGIFSWIDPNTLQVEADAEVDELRIKDMLGGDDGNTVKVSAQVEDPFGEPSMEPGDAADRAEYYMMDR